MNICHRQMCMWFNKYNGSSTGEKIVLEPTYTYIYKQGIQLQYKRYT